MLEVKCAQPRSGISLWGRCPEDRSVRWRLWWACSGLAELTQLELCFPSRPCTVLGVYGLQEACAPDLQALEFGSETAAMCMCSTDCKGWYIALGIILWSFMSGMAFQLFPGALAQLPWISSQSVFRSMVKDVRCQLLLPVSKTMQVEAGAGDGPGPSSWAPAHPYTFPWPWLSLACVFLSRSLAFLTLGPRPGQTSNSLCSPFDALSGPHLCEVKSIMIC